MIFTRQLHTFTGLVAPSSETADSGADPAIISATSNIRAVFGFRETKLRAAIDCASASAASVVISRTAILLAGAPDPVLTLRAGLWEGTREGVMEGADTLFASIVGRRGVWRGRGGVGAWGEPLVRSPMRPRLTEDAGCGLDLMGGGERVKRGGERVNDGTGEATD